MRRFLRLVLTSVLVISLGVSAFNGYEIARMPAAERLVDLALDRILASVEKAISEHVDEEIVASRLEHLLVDEPRNWLAIDAVVEVAKERRFEIPPELEMRRAALYKKDHGLLARSRQCARCMVNAAACDFSVILLCRLPVDATPVGDVIGVAREAGHMLSGHEVDKVDLTLSLVGLAAVAMVPLSGGSSASVKAGASAAKLARRMGSLPPKMVSLIGDIGGSAVEWKMVAKARSTRDLAGAMNTARIRPQLDALANFGRMKSAIGTKEALYLMRYVDTPDDARRLAGVSEALGKKIVGRLELLGKSRLIRATVRYADEVWYLVSGLAGLFLSLLGLFWSILWNILLRLLRRLARDPHKASPQADVHPQRGPRS